MMTDDTTKLCATCAHAVGSGPLRCAAAGNDVLGPAPLAYVARTDGSCGPDGTLFAPAPPRSADVIVFPVPHRRSA